MFKQRGGGGVKGFLNNVQKNCTFLSGWLPLPQEGFDGSVMLRSGLKKSKDSAVTVEEKTKRRRPRKVIFPDKGKSYTLLCSK